jgi:hypothetical protein
MLEKLKREWKTFALAVVTIAVGTWEAAVTLGYDLTPLIPETWRPYAPPLIGVTFLALRKWKDYESNK